jgi:hypothetical protein
MKPIRAVNAETGEIAGATGCKPFEVLRQMPPPPFTLNGEETTESGLFPARVHYSLKLHEFHMFIDVKGYSELVTFPLFPCHIYRALDATACK